MVNHEILFKLSGATLTLGGSLTTIGWLLFMVLDPDHQAYKHNRWFRVNGLIIAGGLFMVLGLSGFYLRQASQAGVLGLMGFILLYIGIALPYLTVHTIETVTMPDVPPAMMRFATVGAPCLFLGLILTGIVSMKAGVYPAPLGITLISSAILGLMTVIKSVPSWLGRNLVSAFITATLAWAGVLTVIV